MDEKQMTLARDWDYRSLWGWYWSEKLDGVRAYWDGYELWTRGGNVIPAPAAFLAALPAGVELDGELWAGYHTLTVAANAAIHGIWDSRLTFQIFDVPRASGDWFERMQTAARFTNEIVGAVAVGVVGRDDDPSAIAAAIIAKGGEGAMFRNPNVRKYQPARTVNLMRIKERNLYAPWRKENRGGPTARRNGETRIHGEAGNGGQGRPSQRPAQDARPVVGLDVRLFPHDPEIEWNISQLLGGDFHQVTKF